MIGQSLLHYQVIAKLGEGGMGEVYAEEADSLRSAWEDENFRAFRERREGRIAR